MCEKKRGKSQSAKVSCAFCFFCVFFGNGFVFLLFSRLFLAPPFLFFLFSLPSSLSLKNPFFPPTTTVHTHTGHEGLRKAMNDKTLALLPLFSQPHHHFTRPLPSTTLTTPLVLSGHAHCVPSLPTVSLTTTCKHLWSCNTNTPLLLLTQSQHPH